MEGTKLSTHPNLFATVVALEWAEQARPELWRPMPYQNRRGIRGTSVRFWNAPVHHMISVHNCSSLLTPSIVAYLVKGIESIDELRFGIYANKKDIPGFYAAAKSAHTLDGSNDHWIMIARTPERDFAQILRGKRALSEEEEDLLTYLESADNATDRLMTNFLPSGRPTKKWATTQRHDLCQ